jgi:hypothetical protein
MVSVAMDYSGARLACTSGKDVLVYSTGTGAVLQYYTAKGRVRVGKPGAAPTAPTSRLE